MAVPDEQPDSNRPDAPRLSRMSGLSWMPAVGSTIKHYELIRILGRGGMGVVYLARDTRLGRLVALKLLFADAAESADRILREARATAACKHENIVVVYDVDEHAGFPYLVLEYVEGQTLRQWMDQRRPEREPGAPALEPLSMGVCLDLILPVVRALVSAHEHGIVHRDLKPENILLAENGHVKVVDFGIAQKIDLDRRPSRVSAPLNVEKNVEKTYEENAPGTLAYMAPESWLGAESDHSVDIWALGIILYELLTGAHPLAPATPARLAEVANLETKMPSARQARPDIEPLAALVDRCLEKPKARRIGSTRELSRELLALRPGPNDLGSRALLVANPFAGLLAFQESDESRFFGRERDIEGILARSRFQPLVAIAGPSGAGKSSFVRAGVIPGWKRLGEHNLAFVLRPASFPLASLANTLAEASHVVHEEARQSLPVAALSPDEIVQRLRQEPGFCGATLRAICREAGRRTRILLFVDQFEEVFTLVADPNERAAFLACLGGAADDASSPLRVVLAMRSDFLDRMADAPKLLSGIVRGLFFLGPMGPAEIRNALKKPVEAFGCRFETEALVDTILDALGKTTSPLPLLQFTAAKLWESRDRERRLLTEASYAALGGVEGTLATHADAVLASMPSRDQPLVRAFFERLVTPERTRAVASFAELAELAPNPEDAERVLGRLVEARLLVVEKEPGRETSTVEIVHESLIARWPMLSLWLSEHEEDAVFLGRLRAAAQQWRASGRPRGLLWRDEAMLEAARWRERSRTLLSANETEFLDAVLALARSTARARRWVIGALVTLSVGIAITMTYLAKEERRASEVAKANESKTQMLATQARTEAKRARDAARLALARDLEQDPTAAAALLREVEATTEARGWATMATRTLRAPISTAVFRGLAGMVWTAQFSPDALHVLTSSTDIAQIWDMAGASPPITLRGHTGPLWLAAYSPDGRRVLTASWDGTGRVWNADGSGQPVVLQHPERVSWATWSPDGNYVATTCWDKNVRVFRSDGSAAPVVFAGHAERARRVRFSPDGKLVVSASYDKTAIVFRADGSGKPQVLGGHTAPVFDAVFSPDGKHVATASDDAKVLIHPLDSREPVHALLGHTERVNTVSWSPDGKLLASASNDHTARIFRLDGKNDPIVLHFENAVRFASFSPDGKYVLLGSTDKTARLWAVGEINTTTTLGGHEGTVEWGAFSADSKQVVTSAEDGTARVWQTHQESAPVVLPGPAGVFPVLRFRPKGKDVAVAWQGHTDVAVWSVDGRGSPLRLPKSSAPILDVQFDPEGKHLATSAVNGEIRVFRADGVGEPEVLWAPPLAVETLAFSPEGTQPRLAAGGKDGSVRVWALDKDTKSTPSGEPLVLEGANRILRLQWSPDGEQIVTAQEDDRAIRVFRLTEPKTPLVLRGHTNIVHWAMWSPDGKRLLSSSADNTVRIWSLDGATPPVVLQGHTHEIRRAEFSPDGRLVATVSGDGTCRVWPADGVGEPRILGKEPDALALVAFSPDGKRVLSASETTLRIWNVDGSGIPLILEGHAERIHEVAWSPDGKLVASTAVDGTIRIWPNVEKVPTPPEVLDLLWQTSSYCMPLDLRRDLLGVSEAMALSDLALCRSRVDSTKNGGCVAGTAGAPCALRVNRADLPLPF